MKESGTWESRFWPCQVSYMLGILPREASFYIPASFFIQLKLNDKHGPQKAIMKFLPEERQNFRTVSLCFFSLSSQPCPPTFFHGESDPAVSTHSEPSSSPPTPKTYIFFTLNLDKKVDKIWQYFRKKYQIRFPC